jgi:hypothetical protein
MVNYENGKIYRIICNVTGLTYIGSTTKNLLSERLSQHVQSYKQYLKGKGSYISSFDVLNNNNCEIFLIEDFPCNSKDQLYTRERFHIEGFECVNIIKRPHRTNQERREYDTNYFKSYYKNDEKRRLIIERLLRNYRYNKECEKMRSISV